MNATKYPDYVSSTSLSAKGNRPPHTTRCKYCQSKFHFFLHLFESGKREHWMVLKFKLKRCLCAVNPSNEHKKKGDENNF